jgi:succinate dehydrogenase / fumarate reductase, cytochrome b subunit
MANGPSFIETTVGRKIIMGLTGLFLCSFLVIHLAGNMSLLLNDGGRAFNEYTLFMTSNWMIRSVEILLVAGFAAHIWLALKLTRKNIGARPVKYSVSGVNETASIYSRNMGITGTIILIFLILHLKTFWYTYKFGDIPLATYDDGVILKDMYIVVKVVFQEWWYSLIYVVSMVLLAGHLNHGFQSAFRSLGLNNKSYAPSITMVGTAFAIVMAVGFALFPILFFFKIVG